VDRASGPALVAMLGRLGVRLGGTDHPAVHRAVCAGAVGGDVRVLALVAEFDATPAGFVVATLDTARYWRSALLRRPPLLARVVTTRLAARLARRPAHASVSDRSAARDRERPDALPPIAPAAEAPLRWDDPAPDLAKIGFIGVLPEFRRRGVGEALYAALLDAARARGARAVLARIASDNIASLRLHHAAGWRLFRDDLGVFAVYHLADRRS
jgi:ribosomal protein S18 acetylase RimI-like enzyme